MILNSLLWIAGMMLFLGQVSAIADTEGTKFFWSYIRNEYTDATRNTQQLTVTVVNGANPGACVFDVQYRVNPSSPLQTVSTRVDRNSYAEINIPSFYGNFDDNMGLPQYGDTPKLTLSANSSCPVLLIANNYDSNTSVGNSFVVLPVKWASQQFVFSLFPAISDANQYHKLIFIATERTAKVHVTDLGSERITDFQDFPVIYGDSPTAYYANTTLHYKTRTYHVTSDAPIQIIAGVTCMSGYSGFCEHAAFMPQPLASTDCQSVTWLTDNHITDVVTTSGFFVDVPSNCNSLQTVVAEGDNVVRNISIDPNVESPFQFFPQSFGNLSNVHARTSPVHVTRIREPNVGVGPILTSVPSLSQYISGPSYFHTRNKNDNVQIICDTLACSSMYIDDIRMMWRNSPTDNINVSGSTYFSFLVSIPQSGFHNITFIGTQGKYTYYVFSGYNVQYDYGYIGAMNIPHVVPLSPSTTFPSTTLHSDTSKTSTSTTSSTSSPLPTGPGCGCNYSAVWNDVIYLFDASDGTTTQGLAEMLGAMQTMTAWFNVQRVGYTATTNFMEVGIITYASQATLVAPLGSLNQQDINNIGSLPFQKGDTHTNLEAAINLAIDQFKTSAHRQSSRKVIVLMAITYNPSGVNAPQKSANVFKDDGGVLIVYGNNRKKEKRVDYAQNHNEASAMLNLISSDGYFMFGPTTTLDDIQKAQCDANCFCPNNYAPLTSSPRQTPTGGCYWASEVQANFKAAQNICKKVNNGFPASDETAPKTAFLRDQFITVSNFYIGLTYDNISRKWLWANGTQPSPSYQPWWNDSVPDGSNGQQCVYVTSSQQWSQTDCRNGYLYVCESSPCDSNRFCSVN